MTGRWAALAAAAALVAIGTAPAASAVTPPPIDTAALPIPATPAPPGSTEQAGTCRTASPPSTDGGRPQVNPATLQAMWALSRGAGQTVAVIDTGVARHRLLPHLVPGGDYVARGDGTQDCDGHGTVVAGIIGAAPSDGFAGIAPDSTILAIRQSSVQFRSAGELGVGDVLTLARAVRTAADAGATVVNVSSVACAPASDPIDDRALGAALAYAVDVKNVVVVVAAGNTGAGGDCGTQNPIHGGTPDWDGVNVVTSPAWYDDYVLTVGSVDASGRPSAFSLAGPWVDVAAPGEHVVSLDPAGDGITADSVDGRPISGTSYAAPVVAGIAALIRSRSPELSARQVMRRIEDTAVRPSAGWDPLVGRGIVDALAALGGPGAGDRASTPATVAAAPSGPAPSDHHVRAVALGAAAVCIAIGGIVLALGSRPLRRRRPAVADGPRTLDAELGSAR